MKELDLKELTFASPAGWSTDSQMVVIVSRDTPDDAPFRPNVVISRRVRNE